MHDCDITAILALLCHVATPLTQAQTATGAAARDVPAGDWAVAQTETAGLFTTSLHRAHLAGKGLVT